MGLLVELLHSSRLAGDFGKDGQSAPIGLLKKIAGEGLFNFPDGNQAHVKKDQLVKIFLRSGQVMVNDEQCLPLIP